MVKFFDLLFYLIYSFYSNKEKGAASTSAAIIGAVQAMNVLAIAMFTTFVFSPKTYFSKIIVIVVGVFFQVTTYIRYVYKDNFAKKMAEKWLQINKANQTRIRAISFIYVLLSFVSILVLSIYWGNTR